MQKNKFQKANHDQQDSNGILGLKLGFLGNSIHHSSMEEQISQNHELSTSIEPTNNTHQESNHHFHGIELHSKHQTKTYSHTKL